MCARCSVAMATSSTSSTLSKQLLLLLLAFNAGNTPAFLLHPQERLRGIVMNTSVCVSVCPSARISPETHARSLPNVLCMLPMSVARSFSGTLTIGRIACRREGSDGSAQRRRSVMYDCLVCGCIAANVPAFLTLFRHPDREFQNSTFRSVTYNAEMQAQLNLSTAN